MPFQFPKYLRDANEGEVIAVTQIYGPDDDANNTESLWHLTASVKDQKSARTILVFIYTNHEYEVGDTIDLKDEKPYSAQLDLQLSFHQLQPLLEEYGTLDLQEGGGFTFVKNADLPNIIEAYVDDILDKMKHCISVKRVDGELRLDHRDSYMPLRNSKEDIEQSAGVNAHINSQRYELALLHAQLNIESKYGEALKEGQRLVRTLKENRDKAHKTSRSQKRDVEVIIRRLVNDNNAIKNLVAHNYAKAARKIFELEGGNIHVTEETVAETYLPRLFPR